MSYGLFIGIGYVGLSLSVLLAQYNDVVAIDVVEEKSPASEWEKISDQEC